MKKFLALICMMTCIFGLSACGGEDGWVTQGDLPASQYEQTYEQWKLQNAMQIAKGQLVPILTSYMSEDATDSLEDFTMEEIEYMVASEIGLGVDGYAFYSAVGSFQSAADSVGNIQRIGEATAKIDDDQIIVHVEVIGDKKNATAEVILSNDMFFVLESAALNPVSSMGELMTGAALNTLIGMGTVFVVLILISCIISCFKIIPKLQNSAAQRKAKKTENDEMKVVLQKDIVSKPAFADAADQSDDLELAAVIAAAVAAYEGSASTDGFVVRSIRRLR